MKSGDLDPSFAGNFWRKQLFTLPVLAVLTAVVTGCPHNEYTVELKPTANGMERTLRFCRVDDNTTNGAPVYLEFPTNELADIQKVYPPGAVKSEKDKVYVARSTFANAMPADVGGNGHYTNMVTSLGSAGFYLERFRGNDDLLASTTNQFAAADQLTELVIGWAKTEFGMERGWKNLRKFLDENFRHDLKNAGLYCWAGSAVDLFATNAPAEFGVRFGQYLLERGYVETTDLPLLGNGIDEQWQELILRRLVARQLNVPAAGPAPKSLDVFTDPEALKKSWTNYLLKTDLYRAKLKAWEKQKKSDPQAKEPSPNDVASELVQKLLNPLDLNYSDTPDDLTVRLALADAPIYSNGQWQDGQVVWKATLSPTRALPVVCYASWTQPDEAFQKAHFGEVAFKGQDLIDYCLWSHSLNPKQAEGWENILMASKPGESIKSKLEDFKKQL